MSSRNPLAGGPDFVKVLRNAIEKIPGVYSRPPPTGGTQISNRFTDERLALLDAISEHSGWNRNQIISAFVDRGLFELFQCMSDESMEKIMSHAPDKIAPTFDPSADLLNEVAGYTRFRLFPAPQRIRRAQPPEPMDQIWILSRVNRERGVLEFSEAAMLGLSLPLHVQHIERVVPDSVQDTKDSSKNAMLELNVQVVVTGNGLQLLPISDAASPLKRRKR